MKTRGVIYSRQTLRSSEHKKNTKKDRHGFRGNSGVGQASEFPPRPGRKSHSKASRFFSRLGTILIFVSFLGFFVTFGPIIRVEIGYRLSQYFAKDEKRARVTFDDLINKTILGETEGVPDPAFSLIIPKIHAKGKIVANVDPNDEAGYMEALKIGVAHAAGTKVPGEVGTIYLFAHSTDNPLNVLRYNAVFYLLKELQIRDEIYMYYKGVKHRYIVTDTKIVEPTDTGFLSPDNALGNELLILQTCWPPGTRLKRLLIFAQKQQM